MSAEIAAWGDSFDPHHHDPAAAPAGERVSARVDLSRLSGVERDRAVAAMRDPAWEGTARIDRYWPGIWWQVGGAVALLVVGEAAWVLGGVLPLAAACGVYLVVQVIAARRCAPRHPYVVSAVASWPLCLPGEGAGPWAAVLGLALVSWLLGVFHTRVRQPRRRRPVRPALQRSRVTR